ncbi:unnamed protein product [Calypogeia fissa]
MRYGGGRILPACLSLAWKANSGGQGPARFQIKGRQSPGIETKLELQGAKGQTKDGRNLGKQQGNT